MQLKAGDRLKSAVCQTQVMVIAAPAGDVELCCGGAPLLSLDAEAQGGAPDPGHSGGTLIGKRYVSAAGGLELLCTRPGEGSLSVGAAPLAVKEAKALPSSD